VATMLDGTAERPSGGLMSGLLGADEREDSCQLAPLAQWQRPGGPAHDLHGPVICAGFEQRRDPRGDGFSRAGREERVNQAAAAHSGSHPQ
jgi:hypothetical protein